MYRRFLVAFVVLFALGVGAAQAGNGTTVTHFTANFTLGSTTFTCSGNNLVGPNDSFVKDVETCILSGDVSGLVPGTYKGDPVGYLPGTGDKQMVSDYYYLYEGQLVYAETWTVALVDNGDGTFTWNYVGYYPTS